MQLFIQSWTFKFILLNLTRYFNKKITLFTSTTFTVFIANIKKWKHLLCLHMHVCLCVCDMSPHKVTCMYTYIWRQRDCKLISIGTCSSATMWDCECHINLKRRPDLRICTRKEARKWTHDPTKKLYLICKSVCSSHCPRSRAWPICIFL